MSIEEKINNLIDNEATGYLGFRNYTLNSIAALLKFYHEPHNEIKTIHIAGTNGKGSVAYMLQSILISAGYTTGLYTSPHLSRINERIVINKEEITDPELDGYLDDLISILKRDQTLQPTYFDVLTLFAFRYFYEKGVDVAIMESGLGGRLDSTNVMHPLIAIITDISRDHTSILGKTVSAITHEKAGIIKGNSPVLTSNVKKSVLKILEEVAQTKASPLLIYNRDFGVQDIEKHNGAGFTYAITFKNDMFPLSGIENIRLNSMARFQIKNSALAAASSLILKEFTIGSEDIRRGIADVAIPGRLHILSRDPLIIFDPAHNPVAMQAVLKTIRANYPDKKIIAVATFMKDKNYPVMLASIQKYSAVTCYYEIDDIRCYKPSGDSAQRLQTSSSFRIFENHDELQRALARMITPDTLVFFTGTFRIFMISKSIATSLARLLD